MFTVVQYCNLPISGNQIYLKYLRAKIFNGCNSSGCNTEIFIFDRYYFFYYYFVTGVMLIFGGNLYLNLSKFYCNFNKIYFLVII